MSVSGGKPTSGLLPLLKAQGQKHCMEIELIDLLQQREIVHPTRIVAIETRQHELRLTIAGYPWWRQDAHGEEQQIVLSFQGVGRGLFDPETLLDMEDDEALEDFRVSPLSEEGWAEGGASYETYCSEPLPQPLKVYAAVEDHLWNAEAPRTARDYLNLPDGSFTRFCAMAGTASFLLSRAPEQIHQIVIAELQRQKVRHKVLRSERSPSYGLSVQIGGSRFVCYRATAQIGAIS
jgi:hypothetical protein